MFLLTLVTVCLGLAAAYPSPPEPYNKGYGVSAPPEPYNKGYGVSDMYGYLYKNKNDYYGYGKYYKKFECKSNSDCIKGYLCSDNYCVPNCGPCAEFDFTTGYCKYLCAKNAQCVRGSKYGHTCFCPYCPGMDGYDKYANCKPPKYLRGICYSYDKLSKAYGPKHGHGYQYNKHAKVPYYRDY